MLEYLHRKAQSPHSNPAPRTITPPLSKSSKGSSHQEPNNPQTPTTLFIAGQPPLRQVKSLDYELENWYVLLIMSWQAAIYLQFILNYRFLNDFQEQILSIHSRGLMPACAARSSRFLWRTRPAGLLASM